MAFNSIDPVTLSFEVATTVTKNRWVKLDTAGKVVPVSGVTDIPLGIALDNVAAGGVVSVQYSGVAKVEVAGVAMASAGIRVAVSANGRAQAAVTTQYPAGLLLAAAGTGTGELTSILLRPAQAVI